jgi:predicted HicB family RNase H-like nuclease
MMTYKGYTAKVEFDDEAMHFHGEVMGIRDVVTFQGRSVEEIEKAVPAARMKEVIGKWAWR